MPVTRRARCTSRSVSWARATPNWNTLGRPLYVICRSGSRSAHAAQGTGGRGLRDAQRTSADGMVGWQAAGLPMTAESGQPYVA